jgi:hypothetical protein
MELNNTGSSRFQIYLPRGASGSARRPKPRHPPVATRAFLKPLPNLITRDRHPDLVSLPQAFQIHTVPQRQMAVSLHQSGEDLF